LGHLFKVPDVLRRQLQCRLQFADQSSLGVKRNEEKVDPLPVLDTFRNFLAMPTIEGKLTLMAIRSLDFAA
jgi:hypothetical protein